MWFNEGWWCLLLHCSRQGRQAFVLGHLPTYLGACRPEPSIDLAIPCMPWFRPDDRSEFLRSTCTNGDVALKDVERHSMVLIGARKTSKGEYYFLLQNWWQGRCFIEVSGEYMHHCQAQITFVKKPITRKCELATFLSEALFAETSADASDTCNECYER
jgi:hypothetical protein